MKRKTILGISAILGIVSFFGAGYFFHVNHPIQLERREIHTHQWGQWGDPTAKEDGFIQFRRCTNCGVSEIRKISKSKD